MIPAVFDCGVLVSAVGWKGLPRRCLELVWAGQVQLCVTPAVWDEYDRRLPEILAQCQPGADAEAVLSRLLQRARFVEPAPLGKQRSRDVKDDRYLACALGARAVAVVSNDRDLLVLEKPFGVAMLTPIQFLKLVRGER